MAWFLYMVRCSDGSLYTGISKDVLARVKTHNKGKGAKYTKSRHPVELVYCKFHGSKSSALRAELSMKKLSKVEKEEFLEIAGSDPRKEYKTCTIVPMAGAAFIDRMCRTMEALGMPYLTEHRGNDMVIWIDKHANDAKYISAIEMVRNDVEVDVIKTAMDTMGNVIRIYEHTNRKAAVRATKENLDR